MITFKEKCKKGKGGIYCSGWGMDPGLTTIK